MNLETQRLILRPWQNSDAEDLYKYASSLAVWPAAWRPPHTSVENSLEIIQNILSKPETYAIVPKDNDNNPVGSIWLMIGDTSNIWVKDNEAEVWFWIGVPYRGKWLVPEAVIEILRHGFEDLNLDKIWCGYYDWNNNSKRVQDKCWFKYMYSKKDTKCPMLNEIRTEHISCITKQERLSSQKTQN